MIGQIAEVLREREAEPAPAEIELTQVFRPVPSVPMGPIAEVLRETAEGRPPAPVSSGARWPAWTWPVLLVLVILWGVRR